MSSHERGHSSQLLPTGLIQWLQEQLPQLSTWLAHAGHC